MTRRPAQPTLDGLEPDPQELEVQAAERRLAEAYRASFALTVQAARSTSGTGQTPGGALETPPGHFSEFLAGSPGASLAELADRAWRAMDRAASALLPTEADRVYWEAADAWYVETGLDPTTGTPGYWPGKGAAP